MAIPSGILQIVPRAPGLFDGVGDYAYRLAEQLRSDFELETTFAAAASCSVPRIRNFDVVSLHAMTERERPACRDIVLHYVNYGYHKRGVPFRLPALLQRLKKVCGGRLITILHELYASSPPWQSAFWLQPLQKSIARKIVRISDGCVVSSEVMRDMLLQLAPEASISIHPVVSTLGEPTFSLDQFVGRDPQRWAIFGGTHLVRRSLNSFRLRLKAIAGAFAPREVFVFGGSDDKTVRETLDQIDGIDFHYRPAIDATDASETLSSCSFGWIDYFHRPTIPSAVILKSGSFASYCAHGVIPVLPHIHSPIALRGDPLPGPYFVDANQTHLPAIADRAKISAGIYEWYRRNASVEGLAKTIASLLQIKS